MTTLSSCRGSAGCDLRLMLRWFVCSRDVYLSLCVCVCVYVLLFYFYFLTLRSLVLFSFFGKKGISHLHGMTPPRIHRGWFFFWLLLLYLALSLHPSRSLDCILFPLKDLKCGNLMVTRDWQVKVRNETSENNDNNDKHIFLGQF